MTGRGANHAYEQILEAARQLSPSAIYDFRRQVFNKNITPGRHDQWWTWYPDGQIAAFVVRVLRVIASDTGGWHGVPWEDANHPLPADNEV